GYTCADLFAQDTLLNAATEGLAALVRATSGRQQLVVVGLPLRVGNGLYNVAAAISQGRVLALVPKQFLPNYQEFYEARWFTAAVGDEPPIVNLSSCAGFLDSPLSATHAQVPFGVDVLLQAGDLIVGIEICEDLWMPVPPSSLQASAGANLLLNLSASNELVGKAAWREMLVQSQAGRCAAAYAYASSGPTESSTDVVFGGHCLIAENGAILAQSSRVGAGGCTWLDSSQATADVDLQRLAHDRRVMGSWQLAAQRLAPTFRHVEFDMVPAGRGTLRQVPASPFVPSNGPQLHARCEEIFGIQCAALTKRVRQLSPSMPLNIGVSGGLDSTLALLVAVKTCTQQHWPLTRIAGITMPGYGTTSRTLQSARQLMQGLGIGSEEIDIRQICLDTFRAIAHRPFGLEIDHISTAEFQEKLGQVPRDKRNDLVFENVQARVRTLLLMSRGFVLGTGDLSEQALGWSTYNGDHMSMYNVNTSIPKTLVRFLVQYAAEHHFEGAVRDVLLRVVDTPISPELLPVAADGSIEQSTEDSVGAYELHDFFLYHLLRFGYTPEKVLHMASLAVFSRAYSADEIRHTLMVFLKRFFANQFKRSCVPDGPKVGTISLSPRGDWRMPSDAAAKAWLAQL
ncbi:MAG: NAD(+) synthase, partial [Pirellulaceae bacterium]|nr:NAD(+) synthase [Pirellulaceae bacterium]